MPMEDVGVETGAVDPKELESLFGLHSRDDNVTSVDTGIGMEQTLQLLDSAGFKVR